MYKVILSSLERWNDLADSRIKLQNAYLLLAIIGIFAAGIVGLVRYEVGQYLVTFSLIMLGVFLVNALLWALLSGSVLLRLDNRKPAPKVTNPRKK